MFTTALALLFLVKLFLKTNFYAPKVHSVVNTSCEAACPMRKSLRTKDNIWWNSALASLRKEARQAWRKAIKTKQEEDWEA